MTQAVAQRAAGLVLNNRVNVPRRAYDELKAVLYNCLHGGAASQNRNGCTDFRAHLAGRIAHVERVHPARGEKLRATFAQIDWEQPGAPA